jgi:hypothetical protein
MKLKRASSLAVAFLLTLSPVGSVSATAAPDWDRVANVKRAAEQIGEIQARGGADQAFRFITACYKTHSLASAYSRPFESCIAQDFMLTQALALIYDKVKPAVLKKMGAPTRDMLQYALNQRVNAAYANYSMEPGEGHALKAIVDEHGMPLFFKLVFPDKGGTNASPPSATESKP